MQCSACKTQIVRNIELNSKWDLLLYKGYDALPLDFDNPAGENPGIKYWHQNKWNQIDFKYPRFWLPFEQISYEDAMTLYLAWVHEAKSNNKQLVVYYSDDGCARGDNTPWYGDVRIAALYGEFLDFIEPDHQSSTMKWLEIAQEWVLNPKSKYTVPPWSDAQIN